MIYKHVQVKNHKFIWRLNLLGETVKNIDPEFREHTYVTAQRAAYECDLVKLFIREKYGYRTPKTEPSLPYDQFEEMANQAGLCLSNLDSVFLAMPWRAREFCLDAGPELEARAKAASVVAVPVNSSYLATLLAALPSRLNDTLKIVAKARQLNGLKPETADALSNLNSQLTRFEEETRASVERILALP